MSLDVSKLERVRCRGRKTIARCPACAEAGHDRRGEHLFINENGSFGCIIYPGDSPNAKAHRKRIFALCGTREIQPLIVHGSQFHQLPACVRKVKKGVLSVLLGRQGRQISPHVRARERKHDSTDKHMRPPREVENPVPSVPIAPAAAPYRLLSERERVLLFRWCGSDSDPTILEAIKLFNATIAGHLASDYGN